jgi:glycosyltransferase involved in cell wall biosynthesis/GNAT superfamily N-acetyltransferase
VSSGNLRFEALRPIHRDKLAELFQRFRHSKIDQYFHPHALTNEEAFSKCSYRGADYYCLVFDGTSPVGYGMLRGWDEGYAEPSLGIAIDAQHQGRGIGKLLMGHLHDVAQSCGATTVRLKVYSDNLNAIKLYQSIGYSFENVSESELLGKIKLSPAIKRIAINTQGFVDWAGGTDFLFNVISALLSAPLSQQTEFYVLIPQKAPQAWTKAWFKYIEIYLTSKLRGQDQHAVRNQHIQSLEQRLKEFGSRLNLISVRPDRKSQEQVIKDLKIEAIIPLMRVSTLKVECGAVGYIYDFQHTQFPQFFSKKDIERRNKLFRETLNSAKVVIVNAKAVADDIKKFFPETSAEILALPFTPTPQPDWLNERKEILEKYQSTGKYFIICNQFWEHKDHSTAFRAFAQIASKYSEVTLVCTGNPTDSRNLNYFQTLKNLLAELKIENRVKILGHIPKRDQIELLKHACAVIQPTLFEGGPGGGAIFDAVALDVPALVSSIPVNQEIDCGRVSFFTPQDFNALAQLMEKNLNTSPTKKSGLELLELGKQKTQRCGQVLWRAIQTSIDHNAKVSAKYTSKKITTPCRSLRWRLRTWLNSDYWNSPVATTPRPISSKIIVGITTTPLRIKNLEPVLRSILRQSCPPDEIHLNIPHVYKRDNIPYIIPSNLTNIDSKIKFIRTADIGPATKIVPVLLGLDQSSDTLVITADDDILMLPQTIEVIARAFNKDSSAIYGLSGYKLGQELEPIYSNTEMRVDVLEGYAHFAVHRKFISEDFTNYLKIAHSIRSGFLHDDVVMANYFALKGVPLIQLFEKDANRRILRLRGAQLFYGIDSDALHNGGGQDFLDFSDLNQTKQAQEIAKVLRKHELWAIRNADESN